MILNTFSEWFVKDILAELGATGKARRAKIGASSRAFEKLGPEKVIFGPAKISEDGFDWFCAAQRISYTSCMTDPEDPR